MPDAKGTIDAISVWMTCHEKEEGEFIWKTGDEHVKAYLETMPKTASRPGASRVVSRPTPPRPTAARKPAAKPAATEQAAMPAPAVVEKAPLMPPGGDGALAELCAAVGCEHLLAGPLAGTTLAELQKLDRSGLLAKLKDLGVSKLPDRQKVAGAVAKGAVAKKKQQFEADYVIIGGGMTGTGIAAELLDYRPGKTIIILDRLEKLGGHWLYAYPYVHLHNFTSYYTLYGFKWPEYIDKDLNHRASRQEIIDYFGEIQKVYETKPNLSMRFGVEVPDFKKTKGGYTVSVQDLNNPSAAPTQIFAKTLIDCTTSRMGSAPPHKPMLGECPNNIYPNSIEKMDIPKVAASDKRIAVIGGGKTGADAVVHLVRNGVDPKQIVWIKKYDLSFGKREMAQDAFSDPYQRAANPLCKLMVTSNLKFGNGVPKFWSLEGRGGARRLGYCVLPAAHPKNDSPYLNHTGGGMLDDEELALLRQIEQVVGVVIGNKYAKQGTLTIDTNVAAYAKNSKIKKTDDTKEDVAYDWAIWCHGYSFSNYEKLNSKRGRMCMGMMEPHLFYPINWWGSASQGGRIMARFWMMYEDGFFTGTKEGKSLQFKFYLFQAFINKYSGPFNTALLYARSALMESFAYMVISQEKAVAKYGRPYMSGMADVPWFSKDEVKPWAKDEVYWYLHIDKATDEQRNKEQGEALAIK